MKRILCISLIAIMLLSTLVACKKGDVGNVPGSGSSDASDVSESETDSKSAVDNTGLEKRTYDGAEYLIVCTEGKSDWDPYPLNVTAADATAGNKIDAAGYKRNVTFAKDFDVKVKFDARKVHHNSSSSKESLLAELRASTLAGAEEFDLVFAGAITAGTLALEKYWFDLKTSEYIKPDAYYYESQVNEQLLVDGHQYFASGFYSTQNTAAIDVTYANMTAIQKNDPTMTKEYLYELVLNHEWTLDKLLAIGASYATPGSNTSIPTDVSINSFNSTNHYALVLSKSYCQNMFYDLGGDVIVYNDDTYEYDVVLDNATNVNLLTYLQDTITKNTNVLLAPNNSHIAAYKVEAAPFMIVTYINMERLSEASFEWTMLPAPLRNAGDEYRAYSDSWNLNFSGIPAANNDLDAATYLYEMFMAYSYDYVYPAYYEESFGTSYQPDAQSCKVFDIVAKSRVVCPANVYGWFGEKNINHIISDSSNSVGSTVSTMKDSVRQNMQHAIDEFNNISG